jgi:acyl-[acyl-carrier-protein]-phospholipid O-acyltransferase/long-chain-fatty-acid--[acyl-carrier-protein] ligase
MRLAMFESSDYQKSLFTALIDASVIHGKRHKIIEDIERNPLSYADLMTRAFILGNKIASVTTPGEHVGILLPNMTTSVVTFFALQAYCRVPAMLNYSMGANNIAVACQTAKIKRVYTSHKFIEMAKLESTIHALVQLHVHIVYLEDLRTEIGLSHKLKGKLFSGFPRLAYKLINRSPQNQLVLCYILLGLKAPQKVLCYPIKT